MALVVHDGAGDRGTAAAVRGALGLGMEEWVALRHVLPGAVARGTPARLLPVLERLVRSGVWSEVRASAEFPEPPEPPSPAAAVSTPIGEADFIPLARSPLARRWTDARWNELPAGDLVHVRPLAPAKAHLAWRALLPMLDHKALGLAPEWFASVERTDVCADSAETIDAARHWLTSRIAADALDVVVSWDPSEAVVTTADVFCYPASDDTTAWSVLDDWVVQDHHDERLSFGRRLAAPGGGATG